MTPVREPRVKASTRRAQAREVALNMMRNGVSHQDLTLRNIAAELGIPLSTLTYAYVSVAALMDDFSDAFSAPLLDAVGEGGLRTELRAVLLHLVNSVGQDPAGAEIGRYRLSRLGSGTHKANSIAKTEALIARIRRNGRENYRLPDDLIARLFAKQMDGALLHLLDEPTQAERLTQYQDMLAFIDILVLAADPQPLNALPTPAAFVFPDYRQETLPAE